MQLVHKLRHRRYIRSLRNRRPNESRESTMAVMIVSVAFYSCLLVHVKESTSICMLEQLAHRQDKQKLRRWSYQPVPTARRSTAVAPATGSRSHVSDVGLRYIRMADSAKMYARIRFGGEPGAHLSICSWCNLAFSMRNLPLCGLDSLCLQVLHLLPSAKLGRKLGWWGGARFHCCGQNHRSLLHNSRGEGGGGKGRGEREGAL